MKSKKRWFVTALTACLTLSLGICAEALEYDFDGVEDTEYYPSTNYESLYGAKYNYGGSNATDYQWPALPYGVSSNTSVGCMEKVRFPGLVRKDDIFMRRITTLALSACLVLSLSVPAFADFKTDQKVDNILENAEVISLKEAVPFDSAAVSEFGAASVKTSVMINGEENYLYPTFDDIDKSIAKLEEIAPNYCALVSDAATLKEAYGSDYEGILTASFESFDNTDTMSVPADGNDSVSYQNISSEEELAFDAFWDIYENEAKNNEILRILATESKENMEELAYLLPYNSPYVQEYFSSLNSIHPMAAQTFNKALGIAYAKQYAEVPNTTEYGTASGLLDVADCTNFVSQILVAGGVSMHDSYPDETQGWWHRRLQTKHGSSYIWTHKYSVTWVGADKFVRFMGTSGNEYNSFPTFALKVAAGDFIALDTKNDGDWNHMGFVCETGKYVTTDGVTYRDFLVAQHTTNYYDWVSSDINHWETYEGRGKFAIVRRNGVA